MKSINDILSSISVLLVFLTLLITYLSTELKQILDESKPEKSRVKERLKFLKKLRFILFLKSIPITFIFLVVTYTLFPQSINILCTSNIDLWNFDTLKTIFILIELGLIGLSIYSALQTLKLVKKLTQD